MSQGVTASKSRRQSRFRILNAAPNASRTTSSNKQQAQGASEQELSHQSTAPLVSETSATPLHVDNAQDPLGPISPLITHEIPGPSPAVNQGLSPPYSSDTSSRLSQKVIHSKTPEHIEDEINANDLGLQTTSPQSHYPPTIPCGFNTLLQSRDDSSHPYNSSPEYVIDNLSGLRDFDHSAQFHSSINGTYQTVPSPFFDHDVFSDPANLINDVFLPGSAYEALHTTLRNRQLWTARPDIPNRRSSQDPFPLAHTPTTASDVGSFSRTEREPRRFELSPEREHILWENYLNEICSWLDMFDNNRHFASTFPQMAKSSTHLRYSILALSARQLERQQTRKTQSESLSLYQEAIHLLLPELGSKSTPVIASCVILCVLEMLSCNPKEWRRHLDGCAYLIQAAGINGFSGKEEQALFWCFARMDVCGGLISEEETIIPINNWRPSHMNYTEAAQTFISSAKTNLDTYANYAVYLVARTVNVLFGCASKMSHPCTSCQSVANDDGDSYVHRWADSFDRVEECGCWTNALQPLWIAGKAMSHYSEHAAIVETLVRIERETGWATAWRVEDLKEFWGEYDNDNCDVDVD
ncbi:uncharacterized protein N7529_005790 [Penicillium soppii]|uniref:uncharacterized protein n=1 Tax=Penicillium soppii TaxID=69789 RepID=UPI002547E172|nr:uncharacterized protein N7529_005790 [Penicillium soppii]KAJ5863874.1 hypothetical protein N7529_005790 [Penicillium soppii]